MERIESASNTKIKLAASLHQRKERERLGEFVAEGVRLVETAVLSGWPLSFCIVAESALSNDRVHGILNMLQGKACPVYVVPPNVYKKASSTESPQGVLLVMKKVQSSLSKLSAGNDALLAVLDRIQDPGNAGTIIRTADAVGCSGVIAIEGTVDLFSDKAVRSSMGSLFHLPVVAHVEGKEWVTFAKERGISCYAALLDKEAAPYFAKDLRKASAVVFGNEGNGVSGDILDGAEPIYIPMVGRAESLNVGTSAAIVLYEAFRQRYSIDSSQQR